jgi:hypothetical protein
VKVRKANKLDEESSVVSACALICVSGYGEGVTNILMPAEKPHQLIY